MVSEMKARLWPSERRHEEYLSLLIFCLSMHGKALQTRSSEPVSQTPLQLYVRLPESAHNRSEQKNEFLYKLVNYTERLHTKILGKSQCWL